MIGLDTNVLVRYLVRDDPKQAALADKCIESSCSRETPGFVSHIVLAELAWVLGRGYSYPQSTVLNVFAILLTSEEIQIEDPAIVRVALQRCADNNTDFADSLIGAVHEIRGCMHTATFDKKAVRLPTHQLLK